MNKENIKKIKELLKGSKSNNSNYVSNEKVALNILWQGLIFQLFFGGLFFISANYFLGVDIDLGFESLFDSKFILNDFFVVISFINSIMILYVCYQLSKENKKEKNRKKLEYWKKENRRKTIRLIIVFFFLNLLVLPIILYILYTDLFWLAVVKATNFGNYFIYLISLCILFIFFNIISILNFLSKPKLILSPNRLAFFKYCILIAVILIYITISYFSLNLKDAGIVGPKHNKIVGLFLIPTTLGLTSLAFLNLLQKFKIFNENIFQLFILFVDTNKINSILKSKLELISDKESALRIYREIENYDENIKVEVIKLVDEFKPDKFSDKLAKTLYTILWIIIAILIRKFIYDPIMEL